MTEYDMTDDLKYSHKKASKRNVIRLKNLFKRQPDIPSYDAVLNDYRSQAEKEATNEVALMRQSVADEMDALRQQTHAECDTLRANRLVEVEAEIQAKKEAGYKAGYDEGVQMGEAQLAGHAQTLLETINVAVEEKNRIVKQAGQDSLDLGFKIAEKIIQTQLKQDSSIFKNILEEALSKVTQKDRVLIKVSESDLDHINAYRSQLSHSFKDIKQLDIVSDPDIESGGCIIETKLGYVDSSISTKMELIKRAFTDLYNDIDHPDVVDTNLPTQEIPDDVIEDSIEDPVEDPIKDPVEDPVEDPIEDPVEDSIEDPIEDPVEDSIEDPVEDPIEDPVEDSIKDPVEEFVDTEHYFDDNDLDTLKEI